VTVTPALTPAELLKAAESIKTIEELERIGRKCFKPYSDAIANRIHTQSYVKNLPGKQGYTKVFKQLNAQGLKAGVNSRDGKHHVFQDCHYAAVYGNQKSVGEQAATRSLKGESAVIPTAQYIETTVSLLQSSEPSELVIGIAAATGRRTIEVLQIGKFSEETEKPDSYLADVDPLYVYRFRNPAKKRNDGVSDDELPTFSTTCLVQTADLLNAWHRLKASAEVKGYLSEVATVKKKDGEVAARDLFNRRWKDSLGAVVEARFSFLPGKLTEQGDRKSPTPKDLRPAYAQISYARDVVKDSQGQPLKGSEILFKGRLLGHYIEGSKADETLRRLSSTLSYYGYRVDAKPTYPETMTEKIVRPACYESDRDWLNSLVKDKTQAETFRYLRRQHEALQAEVLDLRQKLRKAEQVKPVAKPEPAPQSAIEQQIAALTQQVAALAHNQQQREPPQGKPKSVAVPTAPTARLDTAPKLSDRQMKAYQWLDIVVGVVKDHNQQANGDAWQMWALSPRLLKDLSKVNQNLVREFWLNDEKEFNALNEQWGLDEQHNRRRGMKKEKVTDDLNLVRPLELL
jgi:hypothetical protein